MKQERLEHRIAHYSRLLAGLMMGNLLAAILFVSSTQPTQVAAQGGSVSIQGTPVTASGSAVVNFSQVARQSNAPVANGKSIAIPRRPRGVELTRGVRPVSPSAGLAPSRAAPQSPQVASPAPLQNYLGMPDIGDAFYGYVVIPPDTTGAVGLDKVMVAHNNNYRVLRKSDGAVLGTTSLYKFWNSIPVIAGSVDIGDPRIAYDPYNNRWLLAAFGFSGTISYILTGISQTSDPAGVFEIYAFSADPSGITQADFPTMGFNKNWVAVSVNMYETATGNKTGARMLAINYPALRGGAFGATFFTGIDGFSEQPVVTFSPTEEKLYIAEHYSSADALYAIDSLTGTAGSPFFNYGALITNSLGAWSIPCEQILPQATITQAIESNDASVVNAVYRNGNIWFAQTIGLPSGLSQCAPTRTAAQWTRVYTDGTWLDGGRIVDPTATFSNGGKWYAFPSISVNRLGDVLIGFSQFASNQYPSAGYAFRYNTDSGLRDPYIYKSGQGAYLKTLCLPGDTGPDCTPPRNRWGDYSNTVVDPANDIDLWTIQEYAATNVGGTGDGSGRWGTWWAKVSRLDKNIFFPLIMR